MHVCSSLGSTCPGFAAARPDTLEKDRCLQLSFVFATSGARPLRPHLLLPVDKGSHPRRQHPGGSIASQLPACLSNSCSQTVRCDASLHVGSLQTYGLHFLSSASCSSTHSVRYCSTIHSSTLSTVPTAGLATARWPQSQPRATHFSETWGSCSTAVQVPAPCASSAHAGLGTNLHVETKSSQLA